eukprot:13207777-Alexandrium_andersonii.AAC.1
MHEFTLAASGPSHVTSAFVPPRSVAKQYPPRDPRCPDVGLLGTWACGVSGAGASPRRSSPDPTCPDVVR